MKNTLFFLLACGILISCQPGSSEKVLVPDGPITYQIDLNAKSVDFLDQIESISIFGFEETEESLLKPSSLFFYHEGGVLVIQEQSGTVYVFDQDGSFVSKFNRKGDGPEEYGQMRNTVYRGGFIETYDMTKLQMARYDLEGNFLSKLKLPRRAMHLIYDNDRYLLSMGYKKGEDSVSYNIISVDNMGEEYDKALPIDVPIPLEISSSVNEFKPTEEGLLFNAILTDSVMLISDKGVKPFIRFDFGEDWFWTEDILADGEKAMSAISTGVSEGGKAWTFTWVLGPDRIEMMYNTSFSDYRKGYIDRSTGQFYHYKYSAWKEGKPDIRTVRFEENKLLLVMTPDILEVFVDKLGEGKYRVEGGVSLESLMESENPVMVRVKFK